MGIVYAWLLGLTVVNVGQIVFVWRYLRKERGVLRGMERREKLIVEGMRRIDLTEKMDLVLAAVQSMRHRRTEEMVTAVRNLLAALRDQSAPLLEEKHWVAIRELERLVP